ncbi:hypothetical protein AB0E21_07475 [Streptomyces sp. NPDC047967]|uniref:hypothetical protein n=1 Tax=Streptomyces sp. NPDC047967 TaxID=3154924 RepID=UPI0034005DF8
MAFTGFLLLFASGVRQSDSLVTVGRLLHWAAGAGVAAAIVVTRTVLCRWRSGFDWIFAAMWIALTILMRVNGEL